MKHTIHFSAAFLLGLCLLILADAQGQNFTVNDSQQPSTMPVWIQEVAGLGTLKGIDTGRDGEVYIAGRNMLAKYSPDGTQEWIRKGVIGGDYNYMFIYLIAVGLNRVYISEGEGLALDSGQLAVAGTGIGVSTFEGESSGDLAGVGYILGLDIDESGNVYTAGIYETRRIFGSDTLFVLPKPIQTDDIGTYEFLAHDVFVASYTPEGAPRWGRRLGGYNFDTIMRNCRAYYHEDQGVFAVGGDGNAYLAGCFGKSPVLPWDEPGEITFAENTRALASFDSEGNLRWVRSFADLGIQEELHTADYVSTRSPYIWDMAVDADGNLFTSWITRYWQNGDPLKPVMVGDAAVTDPGREGAFLVKHNPDGDILWVRQVSGKGSEFICDLATDAQGDVYIGGFFDSPVLQIEETRLVRSGDRANGFIARYDAEGNVRWVGHVTGDAPKIIDFIAVSSSGDIYTAGDDGYGGCTSKEPSFPVSNGVFSLAKYAASTITSSEPAPELPSATTLTSNYPNPFAHTTTIEYALPASGPVRLVVYDALGREVITLVDGVRQGGAHAAVFDGTSLPSGVYLYRLEAAGQANTGLMTLRK